MSGSARRRTLPGASRPLRSSIHADLTAELRRMIVEHELRPGTRIAEASLCEAFGVSRTPLREALKALASEHLVILHPFRGAAVTDLSAARVNQCFEAQAILESQAARLAAARATDAAIARFARKHARMVRCFERGDRKTYFALNQEAHRDLVAMAGNDVLTEAHEGVMVQVERARFAALDLQRRWPESIEQHTQILQALRQRDPDGLADLVHRHVSETGAVIRRNLAALETAEPSGETACPTPGRTPLRP